MANDQAISHEDIEERLRAAEDALRSRRAVLLAELHAIDDVLESVTQAAVLYRHPLMSDHAATSARQPRGGRAAGAIEGVRRDSVVKPAVIEVLQENGGTMHANDVLDAVKAKGIELSARDPKATIVTALIRLAKSGDVIAHGQNRFSWNQPVSVTIERGGDSYQDQERAW